MPRQVQLKDGTTLLLQEPPFAGGGEGDLFQILSPPSFTDQIVKIYKKEKRTELRRQKIEYLAAHPPVHLDPHAHQSIVWIQQAAYEQQQFVGFLMQKAKGEKLEYLCHAKLPAQLGAEWQKFSFHHPRGMELRLKVCFNVAVSLFQIHHSKNYVLVDMKPENILIQSNGLVSMIDTDSIEVLEQGKVLFQAPVSTPEYTPPEYYKGTSQDRTLIADTWDRFSMAVIFYRLLTGIHPFTGTCKPPYEKCTGLPEMIENGLFPKGSKQGYFLRIPAPHSKYDRLRKRLQELFLACFDQGHANPVLRPTAEDWCRALSPVPQKLDVRAAPSTYVDLELPLPSAHLPCPIPQKLMLPKNLAFLQIREPDVLEAVVTMLFGKTLKQQLKEEIERQQERLRRHAEKKPAIDKHLQALVDKFEQRQHLLLQKEQEALQKLKQSYEQKLQQLDRAFDKWIEKEKKALQQKRKPSLPDEKEEELVQRRLQSLEEQFRKKREDWAIRSQYLERSMPSEESKQTLKEAETHLYKWYFQETAPLKKRWEEAQREKERREQEQRARTVDLPKELHAETEKQLGILSQKAMELQRLFQQKSSLVLSETERKMQENNKNALSAYQKSQAPAQRFLAEFESLAQRLQQLQDAYTR